MNGVVQHGVETSEPAGPPPSGDELRLLAALRQGDEAAFAELLQRYHDMLVRLALLYVRDRGSAEDVAGETWLAVLQGLGRFEGRSTLKTWIFRILINRAKTRGRREGRSLPFSALEEISAESGEPSVEPERFYPASHPQSPRLWSAPPQSWEALPEERLLARETLARVRAAIEALPPGQREVITLRDVEGWPSGEVCSVLGLSETNQRVLLHRARSKVRRALERYLNGDEPARAAG